MNKGRLQRIAKFLLVKTTKQTAEKSAQQTESDSGMTKLRQEDDRRLSEASEESTSRRRSGSMRPTDQIEPFAESTQGEGTFINCAAHTSAWPLSPTNRNVNSEQGQQRKSQRDVDESAHSNKQDDRAQRGREQRCQANTHGFSSARRPTRVQRGVLREVGELLLRCIR